MLEQLSSLLLFLCYILMLLTIYYIHLNFNDKSVYKLNIHPWYQTYKIEKSWNCLSMFAYMAYVTPKNIIVA